VGVSRRIQRVNQLIMEELSQIILKELDFPQGTLVTVTRVDTSPDLNRAGVYIGTVPSSPQVFRILNKNIYFLQKLLDKRLKMRKIPRIEFIEEKETARAARIEELLGKIKNQR